MAIAGSATQEKEKTGKGLGAVWSPGMMAHGMALMD